jgi:hypothetical protein
MPIHHVVGALKTNLCTGRFRCDLLIMEAQTLTCENQEYCVTMRCIHTATRGAHACFNRRSSSTNAILRKATTSTRRGRVVHRYPCIKEAGLCVTECSASTSHIWAQGKPRARRYRGYQPRFITNVWAYLVGNTVVSPRLVRDGLPAVRHCNFPETVLPELPVDGLYLWSRGYGFSTMELQHTTGKSGTGWMPYIQEGWTER